MNARSVVAVLAVSAALIAVCGGQINRCFPGEKLEFAEAEFSNRVELFGLNLFQELSQIVRGNLFISPYSIWSALTLAYFGSEGETRRQLERTLNLKSKTHTYFNWGGIRLLLLRSPEGEGVTFNTLNRAYMSDRLNLNRCVSNILPDLQLMDFSRPRVAVETINNDVSLATEGRIEKFIESLLPDTRFVLINAVFFKGLWQSQFQTQQTRTQEFLIPPGKSGGNVQMMSQSGRFHYGDVPSLGAKMLELPYENSSVSMFLLLPNDITTDSITANLTQQTLRDAIGLMSKETVQVSLPRFNMTTKIERELKQSLESVGIIDLFIPGTANMTAFDRHADLSVDAAIHQATVEVTEEGTVATAATGLINTRVGIGHKSFVCNRPFVFLIHNKVLGITLFAGRFSRPT
ncbi:ovalbumin-related protein X-like [Penaeus japonicus]|uniref:ovalbumin-related protein X-like n=1 Tax=Penaeus japonicus TaxID=27405 RepID=UPI001C70F76F|nr:ovalbumin-related protein X-like [Penaeus japonicus]